MAIWNQVKREASEFLHDVRIRLTNRGHAIKCSSNFGAISENAGDAIGPYLDAAICGGNQSPIIASRSNFARVRNILTVGSILQFADAQSEVWGSGFCFPWGWFGARNWTEAGSQVRIRKIAPRRIHAVRGPLTMARCIELGVECPDVLGDPGLLMPQFYQPLSARSSEKIGIVVHFYDLETHPIKMAREAETLKVITTLQPLESLIDQICSCDVILSSSLHGLILADAYGIPNLWFRPVAGKNLEYRFKFHDYYSSVGRNCVTPMLAETDACLIAFARKLRPEALRLPNLTRLLDCYPRQR